MKDAKNVHICVPDTCFGNDLSYTTVTCRRLTFVVEVIINAFVWCCEWGI